VNHQDFRFAIEQGGFFALVFALCASLALTLLLRTGFTTLTPLLRRMTGRTRSNWDDFIPVLINSTRTWVLAIWIFAAFSRVTILGPNVTALMRILVILATTYQVIV